MQVARARPLLHSVAIRCYILYYSYPTVRRHHTLSAKILSMRLFIILAHICRLGEKKKFN